MTSIDLVQFAHLSAELNAGSPRDELLAREGLSEEDWARAQTLWLGKMAADATHSRFDTVTRFNALVMARRVPGASAGRETRPEPDMPVDVPAHGSEPPEPPESPASDRAPETMVPAIEPPEDEEEHGPVTADPVPNFKVLPFQPPAPDQPPAPVPSPVAVPPPAPVPSPVAVPLPARIQPAVVIQVVTLVAEPALAAAPLPAQAVPSQQPTPRLSLAQFAWLTAWISVAPGSITEIRSRLGLDEATHRAEVAAWQRVFENPAIYQSYRSLYEQCRAARMAGTAEAVPGLVPGGMRGSVDLDCTQPPDSNPYRPALPFARHATQPQPPPAQAQAAPRQPAPAPPPVRVAPQQPAPAAPHAAPRLTLEHHAWLCTELAFDPANRAAILQRYGVDEEQRQQLDAFWGVRVQQDETLRKAWQDFCAAHRMQLLRRTGHQR